MTLLNNQLTEFAEKIGELYEQTSALERENHRLQAQVDRYGRLIEGITSEPEQQSESEPIFRYSLTENDILDSLLENLDALEAEAHLLLGYPAGEWIVEAILFNREHIIIRDSDVLINHPSWLPVMLFYNTATVDGLSHIHWGIVAYGDSWYGTSHMRLVQPPATRRQLTDLETVTIRFYDWDSGEDVVYTDEEIRGAYLWEEAICLMWCHYFVQVRDIWYEGDILYVDLFPIVGRFNVGLGSILMGMRLREAFEQFPHQNAVRFLVGGERPLPGTGYNGFDLNCVPPCPAHGTW